MSFIEATGGPLRVAGAIWARGYRFALVRLDRPSAKPWALYRTKTEAQHARNCAPYVCTIAPLEYQGVHVPILGF